MTLTDGARERDLPQSENDAAGNQLLEQMAMIETNPDMHSVTLCLRDALQITLSGLEIKHTLLSRTTTTNDE